MGKIETELRRLNLALCEDRDNPRYAELFAAQSALAWVLYPDLAASPVSWLTNKAAAPEDCSAQTHPAK